MRCTANCNQGRSCICWRDTDTGFVHPGPIEMLDDSDALAEVLLWLLAGVGISLLVGLGAFVIGWMRG